MCPTSTRTIALRVHRDGPRSIVGQIGDQLLALIRSGRLAPGDRLPPVRVLSGFLRVNRNTVAKVYAALEGEGWLLTTPGRGTFVAERLPPARPPDLEPLADRLLAEAAARGLSSEEVSRLLAARAAARPPARPRVGFVECNASDLAYFTRQLSDRLEYPLVPVLLADLPAQAGALDIVATTMFHVEGVRRMLPEREVIGLMAAPDFGTLDVVAHLPPQSRIALVCATQEGVRSKERSIRAVGIQRPRIRPATLQQPDRLRAVLRHADVVLASPKVLERLAGQIPARARVIPFASVLGEGAVALLGERIRTWRPPIRASRRPHLRRPRRGFRR